MFVFFSAKSLKYNKQYFDQQNNDNNEPRPNGRLRGLILRHQLISLLQNKVFNETSWDFNELSVDIFRKQYPRYPSLDVSIKNFTIFYKYVIHKMDLFLGCMY